MMFLFLNVYDKTGNIEYLLFIEKRDSENKVTDEIINKKGKRRSRFIVLSYCLRFTKYVVVQRISTAFERGIQTLAARVLFFAARVLIFAARVLTMLREILVERRQGTLAASSWDKSAGKSGSSALDLGRWRRPARTCIQEYAQGDELHMPDRERRGCAERPSRREGGSRCRPSRQKDCARRACGLWRDDAPA